MRFLHRESRTGKPAIDVVRTLFLNSSSESAPALDAVVRPVNNRDVSRRLVALAIAAAVQLSAIVAPLSHVHLGDHDTDHHHGHEAHAHLAGHGHHALSTHDARTTGPVLADHDDERIVESSLFLVVRPDAIEIAAALPATLAAPIPETKPASRVPRVAHGPDPPGLLALPPRAPPSFLSLI